MSASFTGQHVGSFGDLSAFVSWRFPPKNGVCNRLYCLWLPFLESNLNVQGNITKTCFATSQHRPQSELPWVLTGWACPVVTCTPWQDRQSSRQDARPLREAKDIELKSPTSEMRARCMHAYMPEGSLEDITSQSCIYCMLVLCSGARYFSTHNGDIDVKLGYTALVHTRFTVLRHAEQLLNIPIILHYGCVHDSPICLALIWLCTFPSWLR